ncbi:immunoglobulin lambda-1 light chain-like [Anomaloglossus baeobatrachus]|uniref:immunoglobulin lambda-1 light chain-like n=1 Tax=Anomaloglossus baeobatrachus TaxID=238106 RepID=UPI003F4FD3F3
MRTAAVTCLLLCLLLSGSSQIGVHQYRQVSVCDGNTAVLGCLVDGGDIQDFDIQWFKQLPNTAPIFMLCHKNDSSIHWADASPERHQPIRNNSNTHFLHVANVTVQDSAMYWCLVSRNGSYPEFGNGTHLSVYGGKDVQAPTVSLFSTRESVDDPGNLYAVCLATGFYPSVIQITWKFEGDPFPEDSITGPFLEEEDNVYTILSILELSAQIIGNLSSFSCEVRHDSSRTLIKKDLQDCYKGV